MVEELKLAIKIDDASIEQSLLKQFANAQKMADKVVLDFKNVNFDDKQIEAKFKEMQKKAGQNPIDLTIGGNTLDMLGQIDKRLTEIFSIGKGKSFIDSSSIVADIGKIENKINELNKKYEEMQKKLSSVGSEGISGKYVSLVDNAEFQKLSQEVQNTKSELSDLKDVISNLTSDNEGLGNFADQLDDRLRGLDNTVLDLTKRLQTLYSVIEQNPETNISSGRKDAFPDKDVSASVESATNSIKEENNVLEQNTQKVKENTQAKEQNANVNLNGYDKRLDSYQGKINKYDTTIKRFEDGGWTSSTYLENVQAVKDAVKEYETLLDNIKTNQNGIASDDDIQNLDKYEKKIKETIATVTNMSAAEKGYSQLAGQKEIDKINKILRENSAMSSEAKAKIKAYKQELISVNPSVSLEKIHGEIMKIVNAEELAGRAGRSMFDVIKEKAFYGFAAQIGMYFGFNDIVNGFKQVASTVIDLNTQITDLAKVSEATSSQIYDDFSSYADIAKDIGGTISDTISATADWSRNGYNLPDSKELARVALLYKNVGDGIDIDTANESLISTLRGFKMEADEAEKIIDIFNNVSNNEPIDSGGIGEALQRSAASFNAANTSLQESVALISTTNSVIQNPEKVGNMWKVVSMRIRSATSELEQAGEDTDGLVTSTADLQKMIKAMTGYDILESDGKTFKSIYDIVLNISKVWNNLSDLDQSSLLQALAGVTTKMFARIYRNINHRIYLIARVA